MIWGLGLTALAEKEVALFSGDITSAFFTRVLLLLDVLPLLLNFFFEETLPAAFFEDARLLIFFLRLSS